MTKAVPKFEPLVLSRNDWPAMLSTCATPGMPCVALLPLVAAGPLYRPVSSPRTIRSIFVITSEVRCTLAASGNWTLTSR